MDHQHAGPWATAGGLGQIAGERLAAGLKVIGSSATGWLSIALV